MSRQGPYSWWEEIWDSAADPTDESWASRGTSLEAGLGVLTVGPEDPPVAQLRLRVVSDSGEAGEVSLTLEQARGLADWLAEKVPEAGRRAGRGAEFPTGLLAAEINALPERARRYVHDLETWGGDPACVVRENAALRESVEVLTLLLEEARGEKVTEPR